ncbi:MAG: hypothetical protein M3Z57_02565 [Candidatus Dormibacteraeota bacterium]|nr:hypothetical protein [Candidatus Dormibacteraeota bacterium]
MSRSASVLSDLWPYVLLTFALVGMWSFALAQLGYLTSADVRAWRRLAALRGYAGPQTRLARAAERSPTLARLRDELDLRRLLATADRDETDAAFLGRTAFLALLALSAVLAIDFGSRLGGGGFAVSPGFAVLIALLTALLRFTSLRGAARRRQERAGRTLGDMMMLVAIMTDGRGLQVEDSVRILSRCATTPDLRTLVDGGWRRLIAETPRNTVELYRRIGDEFRIEPFATVADALTATNVGMAERDTYTRVARAVYQQRLADARMRAARARILVTLPVAGMLIPLLLLLGAPTFQSITTGLGGG